MRGRSAVIAGTLLAALGGNGAARAGEHEHHAPKSTVATPHTFRQAGYPQCVSPLSMVSYNEHYSGGYVGGGSARGGQGPCPHQGTWGWDYTPFRPMSSRIFLRWSNGRRAQGGEGAYATDGPKPVEHLVEAIRSHQAGE